MSPERLVEMEGALWMRFPDELKLPEVFSPEDITTKHWEAVGSTLRELMERSTCDGINRPARKRHCSAYITTRGDIVFGVNRKYNNPVDACCSEWGGLGLLRCYGQKYSAALVLASPDYLKNSAPIPCEKCLGMISEYVAPTDRDMMIVGMNDHGMLQQRHLAHFIKDGYSVQSRQRATDQNGHSNELQMEQGIVRVKVSDDHLAKIRSGEIPTEFRAEVEERLRQFVVRSNYYGVEQKDVNARAVALLGNNGFLYLGVNVKHANPPSCLSAANVALSNAQVDGGGKNILAIFGYVDEVSEPRPLEVFSGQDLDRLFAHCSNPEKLLCVSGKNQAPLSQLLASAW